MNHTQFWNTSCNIQGEKLSLRALSQKLTEVTWPIDHKSETILFPTYKRVHDKTIVEGYFWKNRFHTKNSFSPSFFHWFILLRPIPTGLNRKMMVRTTAFSVPSSSALRELQQLLRECQQHFGGHRSMQVASPTWRTPQQLGGGLSNLKGFQQHFGGQSSLNVASST